MTPLDRALSKAYGAPPLAMPPAAEPAGAGETLRGWVDALRTPKQPATAPPGWAWPPICHKLLAVAAPGLQRVADQLRAARAEQYLQSIAFGGAGRMRGVTSIVLTLAKLLAVETPRTLIIDANFDHPALARRLGLIPAAGLWEAIVESTPPDQAVLCLAGSALSILPIAAAIDPEAVASIGPDAICRFLEKLRKRFDLILIDAGSSDSLSVPRLFDPSAVDAFVHVRRAADDGSLSDGPKLACRRAAIEFLGVIETFSG